MYTGVVKNFDVKLGFGYITMDKNQTDVFVHATAFDQSKIRALHPGQIVGFDLCNDRGKRMACTETACKMFGYVPFLYAPSHFHWFPII